MKMWQAAANKEFHWQRWIVVLVGLGHSRRNSTQPKQLPRHFKTLLAQARQRPNIELLEQRVAVDLITEKRLGLAGERCKNRCWPGDGGCGWRDVVAATRTSWGRATAASGSEGRW